MNFSYKEKQFGCKKAVIATFELISNTYKLFEISKLGQKRRLINFIFSNLKLNGEKLDYTLRKSFDLVVNLHNCARWRTERDSNP